MAPQETYMAQLKPAMECCSTLVMLAILQCVSPARFQISWLTSHSLPNPNPQFSGSLLINKITIRKSLPWSLISGKPKYQNMVSFESRIWYKDFYPKKKNQWEKAEAEGEKRERR